MNDLIQCDLLNAHADALVAKESDYQSRYTALFPVEMAETQDLFNMAEDLYALFNKPVMVCPTFRAELKADLIAQRHQQQVAPSYRTWRWAALGASAVTVASVIAAATWRGTYWRSANA